MCSCNIIVEPPPIPETKKCSRFSPCDFNRKSGDPWTDHPDCGKSDYGTSVCNSDGYKLFFSYHSHLIQTSLLIIFQGQFEANIFLILKSSFQ